MTKDKESGLIGEYIYVGGGRTKPIPRKELREEDVEFRKEGLAVLKNTGHKSNPTPPSKGPSGNSAA